MPTPSASRSIAIGTLIVGTLDISDALIFYGFRGAKPIRIFQSIAGGLFGKATYDGGASTAALGLLLHFFIAFCVVATYYAISRKVSALREHPFVFGPAYGLAVYAVMNFIVLPLSAAGAPKLTNPIIVANGLFAHIFCVGIPTALMTRR